MLVTFVFSAFFAALPFIGAITPTAEEKWIMIFFSTVGMPLFCCLVLYLVFSIHSHKLRKNIKYQPFADFFVEYGFALEWVDVNKYWSMAEKAVCGSFLNKKIICRIDEKNMDRMDFIIYGLHPDKVKANKKSIIFRNPFDMEEPRFFDGAVYKSFNRTKTLTAEIVTTELETLIHKYE